MFFKSKVLVACLAISAVTAFGIGCGDDGDDDGGKFTTSIDESKEMGTLSVAEEKQLCEDGVAYTKANTPADAVQKSCALFGIGIAGFGYEQDKDLDAAKATCQEAVSSCLDDAKKENKDIDLCANPIAYAETCVATVGEFAACEEAKLAARIKGSEKVTGCDALTADDFKAGEAVPPPAACVTFNTKCPPVMPL